MNPKPPNKNCDSWIYLVLQVNSAQSFPVILIQWGLIAMLGLVGIKVLHYSNNCKVLNPEGILLIFNTVKNTDVLLLITGAQEFQIELIQS